jgi:hypothetical protein
MRSQPERPLAGQHCHQPREHRRAPPDWRIEDLEAVARGCGVKICRAGGSHVYFTYPWVREGVPLGLD